MNRDSLAIPAAIVLAAVFIAGAIYFSGAKGGEQDPIVNNGDTATEEAPVVRPVDETDHIRGNPNASIVLVEYSDFDCPFCQQFHETLKQIINEYGPEGQVAWVYRQFPLQQLHPNAPKIAEASECVAELGGNNAFWTFTDRVFSEKPANDFIDIARLPEFAEAAGVSKTDFESCLSSGRHTEKVSNSVQEAIAAGGQGTPHTVVLVGDQSGVINGAQPYEVVKEIIDNLLSQIQGGQVTE